MSPEDFVKSYEMALSAHGWEAVDPLIHQNAAVTFSDGSTHIGKENVRNAFERNFAVIKDERYSISHVQWVLKSSDTAVFLFDFAWEGLVDGKPAGGSGCGTSVLINVEGKWQLLVEHLGKAP